MVVKIHRGDCGGVIDVIAVWLAAFGLPAAGIADTGVGLAVRLYKERQPGKQCFDACVEQRIDADTAVDYGITVVASSSGGCGRQRVFPDSSTTGAGVSVVISPKMPGMIFRIYSAMVTMVGP